jgi:hypothetical protein
MVDAVNNNVAEEEVATQEAASAQEEQQAAPDLTISDLVALRSIVDVASQRGAFKANELEAVGKTYNKLNTFLESVATKKEE